MIEGVELKELTFTSDGWDWKAAIEESKAEELEVKDSGI